MCKEFENEKKKRKNFFDHPERGFEPQIFSNFPAEFSWKVRSPRSNQNKLLKEIGLYLALRSLCNMIANFYCYYFSRQSEASTTTAAVVGSDVVMAEYNLDMGRWVCPTSNAERSAISLFWFQV